MAQLIYFVVLAVGLVWFGLTMQRRIRALRYACSVNRLDEVGQRIAGVLQHFLFQWRILRGDTVAGVMHVAIFWGFLAVLINTLQFLIGGPSGEFYIPFLGPATLLGKFYLSVRDLFEVLVIAAVIFAAWRRLVTRPPRLKFSGEAILILGLIGILMLTDLVFSGISGAAGQAAVWQSPATVLLGRVFSGISGSTLFGLYSICWWVHLVALLYFLNLLPYGKHFHVLTSVFAVFLRNTAPPAVLDKVDFEDEAIEEFGVSSIKHMSWKNWLDGYSCTECGRCDYYCPANSTGKALSPRHIITGTRDVVYACQPKVLKALENRDLANESGQPEEQCADPEEGQPTLVGEVHTDAELWACTTCGACDEHCPVFIEHVTPIVEMRRHLVLEQEGRFPAELTAVFNSFERQGNPYSIGAHERMSWAEGLELPKLSENPAAEYVYFVGCMASCDDRNKETARAVVELLLRAGVNIAVLDAETCCGDPSRRAGNEYLAQMLIEQNAEQFKEGAVKKIVTACPHCLNTLKHEYSQFGIQFDEVLHHSELLLKLLREGRLKLDTPSADKSMRVVYHDSCYLGRLNNIYREPRAVVNACTGGLLEAQFNHDKGYCCGAGGGRMFMEELEGEHINSWRYQQLAKTGAGEIAVACPFCMVMLDDAAKETGDAALPVRDIALMLRDSTRGN
jgi:Fe-S oxidoreductase